MSEIFYSIAAIAAGLIAGGVANACVMRTRESLIFTTSRACSLCAQPAHPKEMLPVIGYFAVKGRCQRCKAVIPWQYPATELVFGCLFLLFAARALGWWGLGLPLHIGADEAFWLFVRDALIASALILIFVFDYRASIIPDRLTIPAMIVALVFNVALGIPLLTLLFGGLLLGSFFAVQFLVSNGRWVGGGDIRMGLLMGFLLGPWLGVVALLLAYMLGAMAGVYLLVTKKRALSSHVPFGTFMALATILTMLWGQQILAWYLSFFG